MYQSFALEAHDDTTRCCIIVIFLVRLSLDEGGVIRENMRVLHLPISALSIDLLKMCFEMIPDQECVTISSF